MKFIAYEEATNEKCGGHVQHPEQSIKLQGQHNTAQAQFIVGKHTAGNENKIIMCLTIRLVNSFVFKKVMQ